MRLLATASMLFFMIACDPLNHGYKNNPGFVLNEAFTAIHQLDEQSFREVTAREALCQYDNVQGLEYLKENLNFNLEEVDVIYKLRGSRHFLSPHFVGYWSYYQESYEVKISDRTSKELLIEGIINCDFGTNEEHGAQSGSCR